MSKIKWGKAPIKTTWDVGMVQADIEIDADHTLTIYCESDQTEKVEEIFHTEALQAVTAERKALKADLGDLLEAQADLLRENKVLDKRNLVFTEEIKRLRMENSARVMSDLLTLAAESKALKADAERYRWLRDNPWSDALNDVICLHRNKRWNVEIDAAMKGTS